MNVFRASSMMIIAKPAITRGATSVTIHSEHTTGPKSVTNAIMSGCAKTKFDNADKIYKSLLGIKSLDHINK